MFILAHTSRYLGGAVIILASFFVASQGLAQTLTPQTIVVFGDEQATGLVTAMRTLLRAQPNVGIVDETSPGSHFAASDESSWAAIISDFMPPQNTKTAVLMFTNNIDVSDGDHAGVTIPFASAKWESYYRARVAALVQSLTEDKLLTIWIGRPNSRDWRSNRDRQYQNAIGRWTAIENGATYLDPWSAVSDAAGGYIAFSRGLDGKTMRLRQTDGIHFTSIGYEVVAKQVIDAIAAAPRGPE
jgi:uncharacterized protein